MVRETFSSPTYVYVQVSRTCGGCALECYAPPDNNSLSLQEATSIVDLLVKAKVFITLIDGGEPLLWDGIAELVKHFRENRIVTAIVSGGEDIREAEALKQADLNMIQFPVEGPEDYHDKVRGKGSFRRVMEAIQTFCNLDIDTHVGTVMSSSNIPYLEQTSDIVSRFPIRVHRILRYIHPTEYLRPAQCVDVLARIAALSDKGRIISPTNCYTFRKKSPYERKMDVQTFQGCVGGNTSGVITCDGYVVPCPHFASPKMAEKIEAPRIWDTDLKTIWGTWEFLKAFRRGLKACQGCEDLSLCGGCRAAAFSASGTLDEDPGCPVSGNTYK